MATPDDEVVCRGCFECIPKVIAVEYLGMGLLADTAAAALRGYGRIAPTGRGMWRLSRGVVKLYGEPPPKRFVTPWHATLELDPRTYPDACMAFGVYELETMRLIRRLLRPGDHFVDGGSNLGYFTTLAATCVRPAGRVDAFEPEPTNRARLEAHLEANGLTGIVRIHPKALADAAGTATIHSDAGDNHGSASLFPESRSTPADQSAHEVPTQRLDQAIDTDPPPRLIKLDLEGAEVGALRGARGMLEAHEPPWIVCECDAPNLRRAGATPRDLIEAVTDANPRYTVRVVGRFGAAGRDAAVRADPTLLERLGQCNLLFRPDQG